MNLNKYISMQLINYPYLYYFNTFKRAQLEVLNQIFNTVGNGLGWHKETGTMVEIGWAEFNEYISSSWVCIGKLNEPKFSKEIITSDNYSSIMKKLPPYINSRSLANLNITPGEKPTPLTKEFTPYSVMYNGKLQYLPDNIEKSWLEGANIIYKETLNFYLDGKDDKRIMLSYKKREKLSNKLQLSVLAKIKHRLNFLNSKNK